MGCPPTEEVKGVFVGREVRFLLKATKFRWAPAILVWVLLVDPVGAQSSTIEYEGLEKLEALAGVVPWLMGPRGVAVGDWKELKTESVHAREFNRNS